MHVVMLSDLETSGGAALAASRLAEALCERHRVTRCVLVPDGQPHPWQTWPLARRGLLSRVVGRIGRELQQRFSWTPQFDRRRVNRIFERALRQLRPDVINLHNLHLGTSQGWSLDLVEICARHAPVVWTLHDMWSFTGRCAYSYECRKFETGCDASCPTAHEYPVLEPKRIWPAWEARRELFGAIGLTGVAPSRWLAGEARRGLWAQRHMEVIPYSLPLNTFRPFDRSEARRALGVEAAGPVILVVAHLLSDPRKGGHILPHVWQHVPQRPLTLLTMGSGKVDVADSAIKVVPLGWVTDTARQVLAYSAADVLLHPAPVDNFPCVVMEAVACGTPVVGFPIGGVPEMVRSGTSGWIATEVTPASMGETLGRALDEIQTGGDLRATCRALAENEYAHAAQASRYVALFQTLLGAGKAAA